MAQPAFFLRLAELAEAAKDDGQRVALEKLAVEVRAAAEERRMCYLTVKIYYMRVHRTWCHFFVSFFAHDRLNV